MVDEYIGPKGRSYLTLVGTMFIFILFGNLMGLVPGLMSPTSNINVTLGCALTVFVYYQFHGLQGAGTGRLREALPRAPPARRCWIAPIYFPIEIISHLSRVLSLSVRLFGNIFGEDLVILILFSIVPFLAPLPMMFLGHHHGGAPGVHLRDADDDLPGRARWSWITATSTARTRRSAGTAAETGRGARPAAGPPGGEGRCRGDGSRGCVDQCRRARAPLPVRRRRLSCASRCC